MSYILDALKKSEAQRRAMQAPDEQQPIATTPPPQRAGWPLPALLLGTTTLLAGGWLMLGQPQAPHPESSTTPITPLPATVSRQQPAQEQQALPKPSPADENSRQNTAAFKPLAPASPFSRADALFTGLPDAAIQPLPADSNIRAFRDLPVTIQQAMPAIKIEGHVYDDDPQARMVILNGRTHREKQQINKDLSLEEITPDGVIMNYQGHVFHIGVFE